MEPSNRMQYINRRPPFPESCRRHPAPSHPQSANAYRLSQVRLNEGAGIAGLSSHPSYTGAGIVSLLKILLFLLLVAASPVQARAEAWTYGWYAAPVAATKLPNTSGPTIFDDQTVLQAARVEASGTRFRLRLSNELGADVVTFASVAIALADADGSSSTPAIRPVVFNGRNGGRIPAGAVLVSDPVEVPIAASERLLIWVHFREPTQVAGHLQALQIAPGDQTGSTRMEGAAEAKGPAIVSAVEVDRSQDGPVIVAVGDSITEGDKSSAGADMSWPQQLARRLKASPAHRHWTVINAGINGNRVLHEGFAPPLLARFDRDVLGVPGVTHVVLLEGINDIGWGNLPESPASAAEIIGAYRQLIARAHARGVKIVGGTLLPFEGAVYYRPDAERMRQEVNDWIRSSGAFDGVIDFAAALADPEHPLRLSPAADSGDHLHPGDRGYWMMAHAVDPRLFSR